MMIKERQRAFVKTARGEITSRKFIRSVRNLRRERTNAASPRLLGKRAEFQLGRAHNQRNKDRRIQYSIVQKSTAVVNVIESIIVVAWERDPDDRERV